MGEYQNFYGQNLINLNAPCLGQNDHTVSVLPPEESKDFIFLNFPKLNRRK